MEGTQGKLGTGLTDGLGSDNAHHFTGFHHTGGSQVTAVALGAHALAGFAGKNAPDFHLFDGQGVDKFCGILADFFTCSDNQFTGKRVEDIVHGGAAEDSLTQGLHYLVLVLDGGGDKAAEGAAVFLGDNHIVGDIYQTTGQITCIRGLQSGIGQTLTGTVRGDEVLQHRHAFLQVGDDGVLDNLCAGSTALLGLGHQATHAAELLDLLG